MRTLTAVAVYVALLASCGSPTSGPTAVPTTTTPQVTLVKVPSFIGQSPEFANGVARGSNLVLTVIASARAESSAKVFEQYPVPSTEVMPGSLVVVKVSLAAGEEPWADLMTTTTTTTTTTTRPPTTTTRPPTTTKRPTTTRASSGGQIRALIDYCTGAGVLTCRMIDGNVVRCLHTGFGGTAICPGYGEVVPG